MGKIRVEAEGDELQLLGQKRVTVQSHGDWVHITGKEGVLINGGGSYVKLWDGGIEEGTEQGWIAYAVNHDYVPPKSMNVSGKPAVCEECLKKAARQASALKVREVDMATSSLKQSGHSGLLPLSKKKRSGSVTSSLKTSGSGVVVPSPSCPVKVDFREEINRYGYGFDDVTNAFPWVSVVRKGKSGKVRADMAPLAQFGNVTFVSATPAIATVTPNKAAAKSNVLTVHGHKVGEVQIDAMCGGTSRGFFKVKVYEKIVKTVAVRLVHEKNYKSTNVSDADIRAALKKVYQQAGVEFVLKRLPAKTVAFDLNGDGMVDVGNWVTAEMQKIIDVCKNDKYDFNIFLVNYPNDGSTGFMNFNQRYGFIHADKSVSPQQTIAHELGHGLGLSHTPTDNVNIMENYAESSAGAFTKWRLRKSQWDQLNPP
jgi:hypothetical protein